MNVVDGGFRYDPERMGWVKVKDKGMIDLEAETGDWRWARIQGAKGETVVHTGSSAAIASYLDKEGHWRDIENNNIMWPPGKNHITRGYNYKLYQKPIEHKAEVVGVKFLTKEGTSPWAGRAYEWGSEGGAKAVHYPIGEWLEVPLNGCYLVMDVGSPDGHHSLFAAQNFGWPMPELEVAYFEAHDNTESLHGIGLRCYRWVKRLTEPCPERMTSSFHDWIMEWGSKLTEEQLRALVPASRLEVIPEVGQFWKHISDGEVFLRVQDKAGTIFHSDHPEDRFYSIAVRTGGFVFTTKAGGNITLLDMELVERKEEDA